MRLSFSSESYITNKALHDQIAQRILRLLKLRFEFVLTTDNLALEAAFLDPRFGDLSNFNLSPNLIDKIRKRSAPSVAVLCLF
jgi:hypothetical protein